MIPFDNNDPEWNDLLSKWMNSIIKNLQEKGVYDQIFDLYGFNHETIQVSEPIINFEELYG